MEAMSKFEGTPGPWHWCEDKFRGGYCGLYDANDNPVLVPQSANDGDDGAAWLGIDEDYYGETALNSFDAALISAAPELLESLIEVVRISDRKHNAWDAAKHAIAKAFGKNSFSEDMLVPEEPEKPEEKICKWSPWQPEDEYYGTYNTMCGHVFGFVEGGLRENNVVYCLYCGGRIV